jgi:hypothetical protein
MGQTTQRPNESVAYTVDVSEVGSSPSVDSVTAYENDGGDWTDKTATVLNGSASVSGDVITTPLVESLTDGLRYHIIIKYTIGGETYEDFFEIHCTDSR